MGFLRLALTTFRLSIIRFGTGWMLALLGLSFNRVTIADLGAVALVVGILVGMHHFISPFQVVFGGLSDRYPVFGYRRTPYILVSGLVASLIFVALPTLAVGLGERSVSATLISLVLVVVFGVCIAANNATANALVAETLDERHRGTVIAIVFLFTSLSGIVAAVVSSVLMPNYTPELMQQLYNLTPVVFVVTALLGIIGLERRVSPSEHRELLAQGRRELGSGSIIGAAWNLLSRNAYARGFFLFVFFAIMGIFMQDTVLEPFGAEVFGMSAGETSQFAAFWGLGSLGGTIIIAVLAGFLSVSRKKIVTVGALSIAAGLAVISLSAAVSQSALLMPALIVMGLGSGVFLVGVLAMMMEMTTAGSVGLYLGLWGAAQGLATGLASVFGGGLHTALIETSLLAPSPAYALIFGFEALLMALSVVLLLRATASSGGPSGGLSRADIAVALEQETAAS